MSEADFTGMDAGEYYAMKDFEVREKSHNSEVDIKKRIRNQREQIVRLQNKITKLEQSLDRFRQDYKKVDTALSIACEWLGAVDTICALYPGYICDLDWNEKGVCAECLRKHMLKLAREAMASEDSKAH